MMQNFSQPIDTGCFHLKISNMMVSKPETRKAVNKLRVSNAETKDPALWSIKTRAGNRYSLVKTFHEMFY